MLKNKKIILTVAVAAILILCILAAVLFFWDRNTGIQNNEVDLSDIEAMNVGAEMPEMDYCDENKVILSGLFGVIVFDLNTKTVSDRITCDTLRELGIKDALVVTATADGKTLYLNNHDFSNGAEPDHFYRYDLSEKTFYKRSSEYREEVIYPKNESLFSDGGYREIVDFTYLIGDTYFDRDGRLVYLRSPDWNMKNLQICVYDDKTKEQQIVDVFDFSEKSDLTSE